MLISLKKAVQGMFLGLGVLGVATSQASAALILSYEGVGVQASTVAATSENFDSAPVGVYNVSGGVTTSYGTLTSPGIAIVAANQYGGAGKTGNYFAIGSQSGTTSANLALSSADNYFGFWWSAADAQNSIEFYSAGRLLGSFSAGNALASLGSGYFGNPNDKSDPGEKFAYLNVTGTNGTTFDQIVFRNQSTGSGFESDNWAFKSNYTGGPSGTIIANGIVPEPSSVVLVAIGGLLGTGTWLRTRRRAV